MSDFSGDKSVEELKDILLDLMLRHGYLVEVPGGFRFKCAYFEDYPGGYHKCENNDKGLCLTVHREVPWFFIKKYNGRKMYTCTCG